MSDINVEIDPDRRAEQDSELAWSKTEERGGIYRYPMDGSHGIHEIYVIFKPKEGPVIEVGPGREDPVPMEPQAN